MDDASAGAIPGDLPRKFGFWTGLFVVAASMVGVGILTTSGYTLQATQSPSALLALWGLGGLLALAGALTVTELATIFPHVGGEYVFVREGFGHPAAFVYGWSTLILGFAAPIALVAHACAAYLLAPFLPSLPEVLATNPHLNTLVATLFIFVFTVTHSLGQRESSWAQALTTLFKLVTLSGLAILGIAIGTGDWEHLTMGKSIAAQEPGTLATSLVYVMYSYTGWNGAVYLAGEIKDPPRNLPRCLIVGCLMVTSLYLLLNIAYCYALAPTDFANLAPNEIEAVAELAARKLFGSRVSGILSVVIGAGILASLSAFILTGPRVGYAMARDGLFPSFAGKLHASRGTPVAATLTVGILSILILWSGSFKEVLDFTGVGLSLVAALVVASIFPLRRRTDLRRHFRVPLYPLPPLLFLGVTAWMVIHSARNNWLPAVLSLLSIAMALPVYWLMYGRGRRGVAGSSRDW